MTHNFLQETYKNNQEHKQFFTCPYILAKVYGCLRLESYYVLVLKSEEDNVITMFCKDRSKAILVEA